MAKFVAATATTVITSERKRLAELDIGMPSKCIYDGRIHGLLRKKTLVKYYG
jgi:hypothetical protein